MPCEMQSVSEGEFSLSPSYRPTLYHRGEMGAASVSKTDAMRRAGSSPADGV